MPPSVPVFGKSLTMTQLQVVYLLVLCCCLQNSVSKHSAAMTAASVSPVQGHGHCHWWGTPPLGTAASAQILCLSDSVRKAAGQFSLRLGSSGDEISAEDARGRQWPPFALSSCM